MSRPDPRELKDEAAEAVAKGKWKKALECYLALAKLEPRDGAWPQKAGEMNRKLNRTEDAIASFDRAADVFAQGGFLLKAIAVCKLILEIEPNHTDTQTKLATLYSARNTGPTLPRREVSPAASPQAQVQTQVQAPAPPTSPQARAPIAPPPPPVRTEPPPVPAAPPPVRTEPPPVRTERPPVPAAPPPVRTERPPVPAAPPPVRTEPPPVPAAPPPVRTEPPPVRTERPPVRPEPPTVPAAAPPVPPVPPSVRAAPPPVPAPPEPPRAGSDAKRRTLPPGASLDQISLGHIVPGARRSSEMVTPDSPEIFEIPLDEEGFDAAFADAMAADSSSVSSSPLPAFAPEPARASPESAVVEAAAAVFPRTPLFSSLDAPRLRMLIEKVRLIRLAADEVLFSQGEAGDSLYVIADGGVTVVVDGREVGRLGEGAFFGEIALLTSQARSATIRAGSETALLAIDRDVIGDLIEESPEILRVLLRFMRDRLLATLIDTSPLFAPFSGEDRVALASKFRFLEVDAGARIVAQGDRTPGLYILLAGRAEVVMNGAKINELEGGDLFGELSLLTHGKAVATIQSITKVYLLELPRSAFQEVIMTHPQVLEYINTLAEERRRQLEAIARGEGYREGRLRVV